MSKVKNLHNFVIGEMKSVEEFDRSKHYVKVIIADKRHGGMNYKEGLNVDILPFNDDPEESCVRGGLYFTTLEHLPEFCDYGTLVAEIKIPENAQIVLDPEGNKYRVDKIEILKFWDMNDFLEHIGYIEISCIANFDNLEKARGLENLEYIHEYVSFHNLKSVKGLENLKEIGGNAYFNNLESAKGLKNLKEIGWDACFNSLKSARGLESLEKIGGDACFNNLKSAIGLNRLKEVGGSAIFNNLKSAIGLNRLKEIGKYAYFQNLKNTKGLENLEKIGNNIYLNNLSKKEFEKLNIKIEGDIITKNF